MDLFHISLAIGNAPASENGRSSIHSYWSGANFDPGSHGPESSLPRRREPRNGSVGNALASLFGLLPLQIHAPKYALTRICRCEYIQRVGSVFEIIAEPNRRAILSLLVMSQQSVGEIERQLRMPQPTVSKHLRVLRDAGFVESTVDAQRRLYRLRPEPLQELDVWLDQFRRFWSAHVDALERHLDRMDKSTPTKKKKEKTRRRERRA